MFFGIFVPVYGQYTPCSTPPLSQAEMQKVDKALQSAPPLPTEVSWEIPVRVTVFQKSDGYFSPSGTITEPYLNEFLADMNQLMMGGPNTFHFFLCGPINYINSDQLYNASLPLLEYSYASHFLNLYFYQNGPEVAHATFPTAPVPGLAYLPHGALDIQNKTGFHELGHTLGLYHTFDPHVTYIVPVTPNQVDHPTKPGGREIMITIEDLSKPFAPNRINGGDRVADTPPGCDSNPDRKAEYPSSATIAGCLDADPATPCENGCLTNNPAFPCLNGCSWDYTNCTYTGNYRDYNYDLIVDPNHILARNLMSYTGGCREGFTAGQIELADQTTKVFLDSYYTEELCGNLSDRVEIAGSDIGLPRVSIRLNPNSDLALQTRTIVNATGDFHGKLLHNGISNSVEAAVKRFSTTDITAFDNDWLSGLTTYDLLCISKHILGLAPLDGYSLLAADANNSNSVTSIDIVLLRKLILGFDSKLAAYTNPWRFIPEVVTQQQFGGSLQPDFDGLVTGNLSDNPFSTTAPAMGSQIIQPSLYCSASWPFFMKSGTVRNGFDAVKLGNVCGLPTPDQAAEDCPGEVALLVPKISVPLGRTVELRMKGFGFQSVAAWQVGLRAFAEDFEYVSAVSTTVGGFSADNVGGLKLGQDHLKVLWLHDNLTSTSLSNGSVLCTIRLKAKKDIADLSEFITLDNSVLETYFLTREGDCKTTTSLEIAADVVSVDGEAGDRNLIAAAPSTVSTKLHCIPNPASERATLLFDADYAFTGNIFIYDLQGRLLQVLPQTFGAERNVIVLHDFAALPVGVLNIAIFDGRETHTVRLVKN